jgi:hypothetical protein
MGAILDEDIGVAMIHLLNIALAVTLTILTLVMYGVMK